MRVAQTLPNAYAMSARWFVAIAIVVIAAIGALVWRDETRRSDAALDDLGAREAELARVVAIDPARAHEVLTDSVLIDPAKLPATTGPVLRIDRDEAAALGLPARTAMVGIAKTADGRKIAVAASGAQRRDRDFAGRTRVLLAMLLAAGVMTGFALVILRRQHLEAELARETELDRLHRAATMAALGSGVAHELATPLGVIVGRAEQVLPRVAGDERATKNLQVILEQTEHIDQVVRGLLGLARGAPIALQAVEPDALVREATELVQHRFTRADVTLEPHLAGALPQIRCEPLLFKHALVNLMLNACDASPAKSTVHLDVTADANEVAFTITDDGEGIPAQHAARAVEPFFTTKPTGTGLGLAIANEIAKTHRGSLDLAQRAPHGTRACIRIPLEHA